MRLLRLFRLPSLRVAAAISAGVLVLFVIWILVDASFHAALSAVLMDLRIYPGHDLDLSFMYGGDQLVVRPLLLEGLAILAIASTACVGIRLVVGSSRGRSIASLLMATALIAAWLGFGRWLRQRIVVGHAIPLVATTAGT